jgi:mono/diheme cytochrome c family protein
LGLLNTLVLKGGIREWREKGYPITKPAAKTATGNRGARLYAQHCAGCHGVAGYGMAEHFPPLVGDPILGAKDPWGAIWVSLYGLKGRPLDGVTYPGTMAGFSKILTDDELAELLTYAREAFARQKQGVTPADVRKVKRDAGRP